MDKRNKKIDICLVSVILIIVISFFLEIVVFNFGILTLNAEERGKHNVEMGKLEFQDMMYNDEDDCFYITGDNPAFFINDFEYIAYLGISLSEKSQPIYIFISGKDKQYNIDPSIKPVGILDVRHQNDRLQFNVRVSEEQSPFKISAIEVNNLLKINWLRIFLMVSIGLLIFFLSFFKEFFLTKLHLTFGIIAVTLGLNMALCTPTYYTFDEREHFIRSYELANFDFGIGEDKKIPYIENISDFFSWNGTNSVTHNSYYEFAEYIEKFNTTQYTQQSYYESTAITYPFIPYICSGLGILIGKMLGLGFVFTFFCGRIFNLFGYIILCALAIKYTKFAKKLMFLIALFPVSIYSAAAYSADPMTLSFSLLSIMLFSRMLCSTGAIKRKELIWFAICVSVTTMCKITYAPLCILILGIPNEKFKTKKEANLSKLSVFIFVAIFTFFTLLLGVSKGINQWHLPNVDTKEQLLFIFHNVFLYILILILHIMHQSVEYFRGMITAMAYSGEIATIWMLGMIILLFVVAIVDYEADIKYLQVKQKICLGIAVISSWGLVLTALYLTFVPVGSFCIEGVQGRYFTPLLLPLLLLFKTTKIRNDFRKDTFSLIVVLSSVMILTVSVIKVFIQFCM